jgi:hypothetical protein
MVEVAWVVDFLPDLESDFSVFHRVDDMRALDGPRFFRLATRLPFYEGAMRMRVMALARDDDTTPAPSTSGSGAPASHTVGRMRYDTPDTITPASVVADPLLSSLISFGTGPAA